MAVGALEPQFYAALLTGLGLDRRRAARPARPGRLAGAAAARSRPTFASRTRAEWEQVFAGTDACVSPVLSLAEAPAHPHAAARERLRRRQRRDAAGPAPRFGRTAAASPRAAPARRRHRRRAHRARAVRGRGIRPAGAGRGCLKPSAQDAEILRLALPAFGALVTEPLFLLADSAIVGRLGTVPLGGLGVASQALTTLVGVSIFLAYGTTAAVARQLGAGHREAAIRQGIDGLWLAAAIGLAVLAPGWPLAPQIVGGLRRHARR